MAINLTTTKLSGQESGVNILVYGPPGVGKTTLCATAPKPVIISAEAGLMSLADFDIPVIEIQTYDDLYAAYTFVTTDEKAAGFETICLDSISEIAEVVLDHEKAAAKDPRQAYGELITKVMGLCRKFRDLKNRNVYFAAKMQRVKDDYTGIVTYEPSMPGTKLGQQIPYLFDELFVLHAKQNEEGETERRLQTFSDLQYPCKDRSGKLVAYEEPNLTQIFNTIKQRKEAQ